MTVIQNNPELRIRIVELLENLGICPFKFKYIYQEALTDLTIDSFRLRQIIKNLEAMLKESH